MIRKSLYLFVLFNVLFFGFPGYGNTQGEAPKRIISLAPSLTKNLSLLDAEAQLVACTNYCTLQSNTKAEIVANAVQVNFEKIVVLQPDLIITTNLTRARTLETIRKLGIDLVVFDNPENFEEICQQFIQLGTLLGKKSKAESLICDARERISSIQKLIPPDHEKQEKIFIQLGAKPLFSVVPGSFMNDYLTLASTENMAYDLKIGNINLETVLLRDPDVIIIVLMGMIGSEQKKRWESFPQLKAVRKNRIYLLNADMACSPTPLSFVESLEAIIRMIYLDESQSLNN